MTQDKNLSTLNVWAFQHVGHEDLGSFEGLLQEMGADIRYICGRREDLKHLDAGKPDILIVLGGPMGLYETDVYPYLLDEIELVKQRLTMQKPLLGICLGAQIIAKALGANVYKGPKGQEIGWRPIKVNHDGMKTPLRHLDSGKTSMMHWHGDTFDMPAGVVPLAESDIYRHQAFSYGDQVLAVQCHPEITPRKLNIWLDRLNGDLDDVPDQSVDKLLAETAQNGPLLKKQAKLFFLEWLENVLPPEKWIELGLVQREAVDA